IIKCGTCEGTGLKSGKKAKVCEGCGGTGRKVFARGGFQMVSECPTCQGAGTFIPRESQCTGCEGHGRVRDKRTVMVSIPAGIDDGMKIRLAGQGDAPLQGNGPPGDLFVNVSVTPHPSFRREGNNIHLDVPISFTTAILGGAVRIPTVDGDVELKLEPGTQPEARKRLAKRGAPIVGRASGRDRGDQWVTIKVQLPKKLSPRQRELLEEWISEEEPAVGSGGEENFKKRATGGSSASSGTSARPFSTASAGMDSKPPVAEDSNPASSQTSSTESELQEPTDPKSAKHGGFFQSASDWLRGKEKKDKKIDT
ncbi:hypothetical protein HDU93_003679, partial [Gonapodya sp. JEL0774]